MSTMDFYKKFNIPFQPLAEGVTPTQYAKDVKFDVVTLHAPTNVKYTNSSNTESVGASKSKVSSLYSY